MERKTGFVEKVEFTLGGFGNQYTTINGERYVTYWDFADGIEVGALIEFTEKADPVIRFGNVTLDGPVAEKITVIEPARKQ